MFRPDHAPVGSMFRRGSDNNALPSERSEGKTRIAKTLYCRELKMQADWDWSEDREDCFTKIGRDSSAKAWERRRIIWYGIVQMECP